MAGAKQAIVTFKVDEELARRLRRVGNRSQFIRAALLAALEDTCPLCGGAGTLGREQRRIWDRFVATHPLAECSRCHESVPTCGGRPVRHACTAHHEEH